MAKDITVEIIERLGVLSSDGRFSKEVNIVSWSGGDPVLDIRTWDRETNRARKGLTIQPAEVGALAEAVARAAEHFAKT